MGQRKPPTMGGPFPGAILLMKGGQGTEIWVNEGRSIVNILFNDGAVGTGLLALKKPQPMEFENAEARIRKSDQGRENVEGEGDAYIGAGLLDIVIDRRGAGGRTELGGEITLAIHAFFGHAGVELEGVPDDFHGEFGPRGEGRFQAALADVAPGAYGVGNDIDEHAASLPDL